MITGTLIGESLRVGSKLKFPGLRLVSVARWDLSEHVSPSQPKLWTVIDFEADHEDADRLAEAIAEVLSPTGGWYCDFKVGDEHVVVFAGKAFRYRTGDPAGRAEAQQYGESVGVPVHQLDWPE